MIDAPAASADATSIDAVLADAPPDGRPDAPLDADLPRVVTVHATGNPSYLAYRDGSGAWATPAPLGGDTYVITVLDSYLVLAACTGTDPTVIIDAEEYGATAAESDHLEVACQPLDSPAPPQTLVFGSMAQAGSVQMGTATASSIMMPWSFDFDAPIGTNELVAIGPTDTKIVRDIYVGDDQSPLTIDTTVGGAPNLVGNETVTNSNPPADTVTTSVDVFTAHEAMTIFQLDTLTPTLVPPSLLEPGEAETVTVSAFDGFDERSVETFDPTVTTFDLPPRIPTLSLDTSGPVISASWPSLPLAGEISLSISQPDSMFAIVAIQVSPAWLAATGATSLAFDPSAPGWQPTWSIWTDVSFTITFGIQQLSPTGVVATSRVVPFIR